VALPGLGGHGLPSGNPGDPRRLLGEEAAGGAHRGARGGVRCPPPSVPGSRPPAPPHVIYSVDKGVICREDSALSRKFVPINIPGPGSARGRARRPKFTAAARGEVEGSLGVPTPETTRGPHNPIHPLPTARRAPLPEAEAGT
jgi:hypothetical protein